MIKKYLFLLNLAFTEVKAHTQAELRSKVLNALRASSETAEIKVTQSDSKIENIYTLSLKDLDPKTLQLKGPSPDKDLVASELLTLGLNPDILSYSYFNSEIAKPFGFSKKFHMTYTPVVSSAGGLSHFLVYYDKTNFYPTKVTYFNGNKKVMTIEYLDYKKIQNKVWRAQVITSENHGSQKRTRIEFSKIEINSSESGLRLGKKEPDTSL